MPLESPWGEQAEPARLTPRGSAGGHCGLTPPEDRCPATHERIHPDTASVVGLTTARLSHTPEDG
ncbi:hypothetical protein [Streptomyces sp. NPDC048577]|uniref:hypothetical protein n=1 Tax=Streptomyces sp. NPDC048577 TaxID=3157209 RepID=UPI003442A8EC